MLLTQQYDFMFPYVEIQEDVPYLIVVHQSIGMKNGIAGGDEAGNS